VAYSCALQAELQGVLLNSQLALATEQGAEGARATPGQSTEATAPNACLNIPYCSTTKVSDDVP
jgi:hypothetical protein